MKCWFVCVALATALARAAEPGDPDRWMEGEGNARFNAWLAAEGEAARAALDALPARAAWAARLRLLARTGVHHRLHTLAGARVLALRSQGGAEAALVALEPSGRERVLLTPEEPLEAITTFSVSPDARTVAANLRRDGGEVTRIVFVDVASGRRLPDVLDDVWGEFAAAWQPDGRSVSYVQLAPPDQRDAADFWLNQRVRLHRLGQDAAHDRLLLARGLGDHGLALAPHQAPAIQWPGAGLALAIVGGAQPQLRLCVGPAAAAARAQARWRCLTDFDDGVVQAQAVGRALYLVSTKGAPSGRLLRLELTADATLAAAREVLAEAPGAVITGFGLALDGVYVQRMQAGTGQLLRLPLDAGGHFGPAQGVPLPVDGGMAQLETNTRARGALVTLQGWTTPHQTWHYRPDASSIWMELPMGTHGMPAFAGVRAQRVTARSADGTEVPMTVLRRASGAPRATAIVEGYAAYGVSLEPAFDPYRLAFAQAGQVVAFCHARGGGELGDAWRLAGQGAHKGRGVEDFIACAQTLKANGWAERVVAQGASMGGVLVGGALTRAPQAFEGAIIVAGLLNPSRLAAAPNGANQFAEVGDPHTPQGRAQLRALDPVLGVQDGQRYPPVLLMVGLDDQRVAPWFSGKFAARLRAAHPANRVWLRTDAHGGHRVASGLAQADAWADAFAFALDLP